MNNTPNNQYKADLKDLMDKVFLSTDSKEVEDNMKEAKAICYDQYISWQVLIEKFEKLNDLGILKIGQESLDLLKPKIQQAEAAKTESVSSVKELRDIAALKLTEYFSVDEIERNDISKQQK